MPTTHIPEESTMLDFGRSWAGKLDDGCMLFLSGELGSGKTTLVRGILSGFGFDGVVTSPTYTLVEPYAIGQMCVYHFDLYRVKSVEELEMIGMRDMIGPGAVSLIEWPDRGAGFLPEPDYEFLISYSNPGRNVTVTQHK